MASLGHRMALFSQNLVLFKSFQIFFYNHQWDLMSDLCAKFEPDRSSSFRDISETPDRTDGQTDGQTDGRTDN